MNSNRLSKLNLPSAPKPSKLLAPTRLRQTVSSLTFQIPQLAHYINQYELVLSWTTSQTPRTFSLLWIWWGKDLVYDPLMGMTLERVRVEDFGESRVYKIVDESILFFSRVSLSKLSTFHRYKGIYSRVWDGMWKVTFQQNRVHGESLATGMSYEFQLPITRLG